MTAASAGDLKYRVRFDAPGGVEDPYGGTTNGWVEQFSRAARIQPMKGSEPVIAQRLQGQQPVLIIVRRDSLTRTVLPDWRAVEVLNGAPVAYYAIKAPPQDMERDGMFVTILAVQGAADGGAG